MTVTNVFYLIWIPGLTHLRVNFPLELIWSWWRYNLLFFFVVVFLLFSHRNFSPRYFSKPKCTKQIKLAILGNEEFRSPELCLMCPIICPLKPLRQSLGNRVLETLSYIQSFLVQMLGCSVLKIIPLRKSWTGIPSCISTTSFRGVKEVCVLNLWMYVSLNIPNLWSQHLCGSSVDRVLLQMKTRSYFSVFYLSTPLIFQLVFYIRTNFGRQYFLQMLYESHLFI